jgi:hypothetical protein
MQQTRACSPIRLMLCTPTAGGTCICALPKPHTRWLNKLKHDLIVFDVACFLHTQEIHNPRQQTPASSSRGGGRSGRGRGRGRGRGNGSRANSMDGPDETNGAEDFGEDSASVAPAGWEEQDGEEFAGGRCVTVVLDC